jgi:hypothetical protein
MHMTDVVTCIVGDYGTYSYLELQVLYVPTVGEQVFRKKKHTVHYSTSTLKSFATETC